MHTLYTVFDREDTQSESVAEDIVRYNVGVPSTGIHDGRGCEDVRHSQTRKLACILVLPYVAWRLWYACYDWLGN